MDIDNHYENFHIFEPITIHQITKGIQFFTKHINKLTKTFDTFKNNDQIELKTTLNSEQVPTYFNFLYTQVQHFQTTRILAVEELVEYLNKSNTSDFDSLTDIDANLSIKDPMKLEIASNDILVGLGKCSYLLCHRMVLSQCKYFRKLISKQIEHVRNKKLESNSDIKNTIAIDLDNIIKDDEIRQVLLHIITFLYTNLLVVQKHEIKKFQSFVMLLDCPKLNKINNCKNMWFTPESYGWNSALITFQNTKLIPELKFKSKIDKILKLSKPLSEIDHGACLNLPRQIFAEFTIIDLDNGQIEHFGTSEHEDLNDVILDSEKFLRFYHNI